MILFIIKLIFTRKAQERIVLSILNDIPHSDDHAIDGYFAENIVELIAKSKGNKFTTFVVDGSYDD